MNMPEIGTRKILIYGNQLLLSAIGAILQAQPGFEVRTIEDSRLVITDKPDHIPPDVIVFDLAATRPRFASPMINAHPTILMIGVDLANNRMLVLSGKEFVLLTEENMVRAIRQAL